jgi:hypothetical protein
MRWMYSWRGTLLQCMGPRLFQRLSELRLSMLWPYWLFTQTRIKRLSLVFFIGLALFWLPSGVRAEEATETWVPLIPPYVPQNTKIPIGYDCKTDGGHPFGWGMITPDPAWYAWCGHCIPTSTPYPATPDPEEPTPTVTPTPIVGGLDFTVVRTGTGCSGYTSCQYDYEIVYMEGGWIYIDIWMKATRTSFTAEFHADQTFRFDGIDQYRKPWYWTTDYWDAGNRSRWRSSEQRGDVGNNQWFNDWGARQWSKIWLKDDNIYPSLTIRLNGQSGGSGSWVEAGFKIWLYTEYEHYPEEPEPQPLSHCHAVWSYPTDVPVGYYDDPWVGATDGTSSSGVTLPNPIVGPPYLIDGNCPGVGGWSIELRFWQFEFPGMFFCFHPILFGNVGFMEYLLNLDWVALIMAGILAIRWFFRS